MKPTTLPTIAQTEAAYDVVQRKQNELRSRRAEIAPLLASAATPRTDTGQQAIALLDGPGDEDVPVVDRAALEHEAEILDRAIQVNEQRVSEAARQSRWSTSVAPAIKTTEAPWLRFFLQRGIRDTLRRANAERFRLEKPTPTAKGK
ncbi:MAG: hypothetical protein NTW96_24975 [Planctomycetia bacterium]|nr:hypothetical protein [Planctomycetia bacterium]